MSSDFSHGSLRNFIKDCPFIQEKFRENFLTSKFYFAIKNTAVLLSLAKKFQIFPIIRNKLECIQMHTNRIKD